MLSRSPVVTRGIIQQSRLSYLHFLLYINNHFYIIRHGIYYWLTEDINLVYKFSPKISILLQTTWKWSAAPWFIMYTLMQFSYYIGGIHAHKCHIPSRIFEINQEVASFADTVPDLGLLHRGRLNSSDHTMTEVAMADRLTGSKNKFFVLKKAIRWYVNSM